MAKPKVLLLGATGQTGQSIVDGLLESGDTVGNPVYPSNSLSLFELLSEP